MSTQDTLTAALRGSRAALEADPGGPTPFRDPEAEEALLASSIADAAFARSDDLHPSIFTGGRKLLASSISKLACNRQGITRQNLKSLGLNDAALTAFDIVVQRHGQPPLGSACRPIIEKLRTLAVRREAAGLAEEICKEAGSMAGPDIGTMFADSASSIERLLDHGVGDTFHDGSHLNAVIEEMKWRIENPDAILGLETGMLILDRTLNGLQPGRLIVVGGRAHAGKTSVALNLAAGLMKNGHKLGFFSLEITATQLQQGMLDIVSGTALPVGARPTRDDLRRIKEGITEMSEFDWWIEDAGRIPINRMRAKARIMKRKHGIEALFVDYLQIASGSDHKDDMRLSIGEITGKLKALAKELDIPIVLLSQLNRTQSKTNPDTGKPIYGRPSLSGLKESSSIESDSDVVILIHRELEDEEEGASTVDCDLIIAKNRCTGQLRDIHCEFDKRNRRVIENFRN